MKRVATTFRVDPVLKDGLVKLSALTQKSLNQLANEAIREYVARRTLEVEEELEATLKDLRAYRQSDPDFERAIAEVVKAEATNDPDPAEGRVVSKAGRTEAAILDLLNE